MRKLAAWGLAASIVVGLGVAVAAAAEDDSEGSSAKSSARSPTWQWKPFGNWFGSQEVKKPVEKKAPKPDQTTAKKPTAPVKMTSIVDEAAAKRSREEAALLRRLQACDKLREIAIQTEDNDLLRRAEELEERAQSTYVQRTASFQGSGGSFESDEKTIDRYLGAGKARPADSSAYTVSGNDRSSRAAVEIKP
jgi:hypothetical protein